MNLAVQFAQGVLDPFPQFDSEPAMMSNGRSGSAPMQESAHNPVRIRPEVVPVGSSSWVADPPPLPAPAAPLVGREAEVDTALALLSNPDVRLLTLTGPGGVGKTRLALHVARSIAENARKLIWFIPLASVRDPDAVMPAIASGLGVRESRKLSPVAEISRQLGNTDALLILDNVEQVIDSATAIANLLSGLPNSQILITSREPLRVSGEHVLPVPCLKSPDALRRLSATEIGELSAVKLFVARASASAPGFTLDDDAATECCGDLPPPGWAAVGDRTCRHLDSDFLAAGNSQAPRAPAADVDEWAARSTRAPADNACGNRLESRSDCPH